MLQQIKYSCKKKKEACICSRCITSWNNPKEISALLHRSDMCCFSLSQCLLLSSHLCFYKQDSATNTKIHKQKFKTGSQTTPFQQVILKLTTNRLQWVHKHSLLTPVNSQSNSWKNSSSGHMAFPSVGGWGKRHFSDQQEKERLYIFLVASNLLVMTKCTSRVHVNTELGSRFHAQAQISFLKCW
jgi:hypothetical protein